MANCGLAVRCAVLADETGLGKTVMSFAVAVASHRCSRRSATSRSTLATTSPGFDGPECPLGAYRKHLLKGDLELHHIDPLDD